MQSRGPWAGVALSLVAALSLIFAGCGKNEGAKKDDKDKGTQVAKKDDKKDEKKGDTKHSGWWCDEHGVPEGDCSMCSDKAAAEFKKKGDWCKEHERAKSQCFICDPKLKDKFAAGYKAKEGKDPPPPTENMPKCEKKEDKKEDKKEPEKKP